VKLKLKGCDGCEVSASNEAYTVARSTSPVLRCE